MHNFRKISLIILTAIFVCAISGGVCSAQETYFSKIQQQKNQQGNTTFGVPSTGNKSTGMSKAECDKTCTKSGSKCVYDSSGNTSSYVCVDYGQNTKSGSGKSTPKPVGTSDTQSSSAVTGCSADFGLFAGLIKTGRDIFAGLRDLIYVVAGFGIIGVAVGGFFGNLNWKWLGAIIIALVVIASTGEIINMITGCENFSSAMITDTLK